MLYPGNLALSQSRLEDFVHCAFGYHCKHVLKLQETRPAVIRPTDTGVFVHHILDRFFRAIRTETGIRTDIEDDEIEALADRIIGEYLAEIFGGKNRSEQQSSRLLDLFRRLKRSTMIVIRSLLEEFASSSFVPTFFELPISYATEENAIPPLSIRLEDGKNAYIIGRIDRVDTFKKGNDVYVRVVDYKTGSKTFSVKDLSLGLNMQMLLYLFAIWNNATPAVKEAMGIEADGRVLPAGVLYCSAKPPSLSLEHPLDSDAAQKELSGSMKRSGMLLYDEEILHAMDHSEGMRFLPIKFGKDGAPSSYTLRAETLQTLEGFGEKMRVLSKRVEEIAKEIRLGNCSALPLKEKSSQTDACRFCAMKAVCRNFKYAKSPQRTEKGVIDDA
jgi:ATP-dependent helicase/nuclease subunit B